MKQALLGMSVRQNRSRSYAVTGLLALGQSTQLSSSPRRQGIVCLSVQGLCVQLWAREQYRVLARSIESARVRNQRETALVRGGSASPAWGRPVPNPGAPDSFAPGLLHKEAEEGFPAGDGGAAWDKPQVWQGRGVRWHQERWHQKRWQGSRGAAGRGTDRAAAPGCGWWYGRPCWVRRMCGWGALGPWLSFQHKIGILYCRAGQSTEEEMYNNETAGPAFEEFLDLLGQRVRLKGFSKYRAQLDNKSKLQTCLCVHRFNAPEPIDQTVKYLSAFLLLNFKHHSNSVVKIRNAFPVHDVQRLRAHVPRVYHASTHAQQQAAVRIHGIECYADALERAKLGRSLKDEKPALRNLTDEPICVEAGRSNQVQLYAIFDAYAAAWRLVVFTCFRFLHQVKTGPVKP
eukprot:bmy_13314T0